MKMGKRTETKRQRRGWLWGAGMVAAACCCAAVVPLAAQEAVPQASSPRPFSERVVIPRQTMRLFNGTDLSGWYTFFPSKGVNSDPENIITVQEGGVIRVTGKEFGYFATTRNYAN